MKSRKQCAICESPYAKSVHFGARSCKIGALDDCFVSLKEGFRKPKACAAFFRRTIALGVNFECKEPVPCTIHYEKRMSCKKCRFDKCIASNMNPDLVRSTHGAKKTTEARWNKNTTTSDPKHTSVGLGVVASSTPEPTTSSLDTAPLPYNREVRRRVREHYIRIEAALNNRRKIMYTDAKMMSVFTSFCKCPYEKRHLKPLNYKEFAGLSRADFIMLYDYTITFMDFHELEASQKNILYRYVCGMDVLMNSAYFTCCLTFDDKWLVLSTSEYICVDPMPMTGDEPWAQHLFSSKEDLMRYKSIVPWKASLWSKLIEPFHLLDLHFEEFCILKALACWHMSHFKFNDSARQICDKQRNLLIGCLFDVCREFTEDPSERVGNLILFLSCVFVQIFELVNSVVMATFFDIVDYDPVIKDFFEHQSY